MDHDYRVTVSYAMRGEHVVSVKKESKVHNAMTAVPALRPPRSSIIFEQREHPPLYFLLHLYILYIHRSGARCNYYRLLVYLFHSFYPYSEFSESQVSIWNNTTRRSAPLPLE
jgi:hypothetical protein